MYLIRPYRLLLLSSCLASIVPVQGDEPIRRIRHRRDSFQEDANNGTVSEKIVGGTMASPGEFPSFVWLGGCGGSLVADDVVLSAGHCFDAFYYDSVLVGTTIKNSAQQATAEWRKFYPNKRVVHPNYNPKTVANDFMLVKIQRVSNAAQTPPVKLDTTGSTLVNNAVQTVIGFGTTSENSNHLTKNLRKVDVNYIPTSVCNNLNAYKNQINANSMFCAGVSGGGKDSCSGDSGGPIFDKATGVQVGTVSWGLGCARANAPGVYGRVAGQIQWIQKTICALTDTTPDFC